MDPPNKGHLAIGTTLHGWDNHLYTLVIEIGISFLGISEMLVILLSNEWCIDQLFMNRDY